MTTGKTIALMRQTFISKAMKTQYSQKCIIVFKKADLWQTDRETVERVSDFIFGGAPKSLQMVTAAMKLKDDYSLEGKL